MTKILIADDEASIRTIVSRAMEAKGFEVVRAHNGAQALEYLQHAAIDVAILDIRMPDGSGLDLLDKKDSYPSQPILFIITAQDTMENAVEAMKRGAYDYLTKPFDLEELSLLVDRALETRALRHEVKVLKETHVPYKIIGKSKVIQEVFKTIGRVADQDVTVLIQGESGTGKELVARAIHFQGRRRGSPFVAVNCGAIPENLLESELFGFKKGAYTGATHDKVGYFELASGGTLFLDEIGDMPISLQAKILRVLQEKEIQRLGDTRSIPLNIRLIAATNQDLAGQVKVGEFREDLYFRLHVMPIRLPPLRDRQSDIPLLIDYFMDKNAREFNMDPKRIASEAMVYLTHQSWPGNIRELENVLKQVFLLSPGSVLEMSAFTSLEAALHSPVDIKDLEDTIGRVLQAHFQDQEAASMDSLYDKFMPMLERPLIQLALRKTKGNQVLAAKILGMNRNTLRKKIKEMKVERRGLVRK